MTVRQRTTGPTTSPFGAAVPSDRPSLIDALLRQEWANWPDADTFQVLAQGHDPHTVAENGDTVLMMLAHARRADLVAVALEQGWNDPAAVNEDGMSAWLYAAREAAPEVLDRLAPWLGPNERNLQNPVGYSALHLALLAGAPAPASTVVVQTLLKHGVAVDLASQSPSVGCTALMFAAEGVTPIALENVRALLAAGASLSAVDGHGASALSWAAEVGSSSTVALLLAAGASPAHVTHGGNTLLMDAMSRGTEQAQGKLDVLLPVVDPNAQNEDGATALDIALDNGHLQDAGRLAAIIRPDLVQHALLPRLGQTPGIDAWFQAAQAREQQMLQQAMAPERVDAEASPSRVKTRL